VLKSRRWPIQGGGIIKFLYIQSESFFIEHPDPPSPPPTYMRKVVPTALAAIICLFLLMSTASRQSVTSASCYNCVRQSWIGFVLAPFAPRTYLAEDLQLRDLLVWRALQGRFARPAVVEKGPEHE
jgi:hypothetical protein